MAGNNSSIIGTIAAINIKIVGIPNITMQVQETICVIQCHKINSDVISLHHNFKENPHNKCVVDKQDV